MQELAIDVIVPVYRPGQELQRLLTKLKEQTVCPERILLVNTEKKYFDERCLEAYPEAEVIHISKSEFDHGGTRHMAAMRLSSPLILFMTQDAVPEDEFLIERLVEAFQDPQVAAAYARQLPQRDCNTLERYTRSFNYGPNSRVKTSADLSELGIKTFFCSNVCAAYRRADYEALQGFERKTIFNEDMIFAGRLIQEGKAVAYCAEARVIHSHNYSGIQQFHRNFDLGVSQADHPEIFATVKSESEGIRMVKNTAQYLNKIHQQYLLPVLIWQSACKYLGYRLGKRWKSLPRDLVLRCTMNPSYWEGIKLK